MSANDFCEEHLADSDHASPSSIAYIAAFNIMVKLRKAGSIGKPRNRAKLFSELLSLLLSVFSLNQYFISKQVETISSRNGV